MQQRQTPDGLDTTTQYLHLVPRRPRFRSCRVVSTGKHRKLELVSGLYSVEVEERSTLLNDKRKSLLIACYTCCYLYCVRETIQPSERTSSERYMYRRPAQLTPCLYDRFGADSLDIFASVDFVSVR